jgi:hypothetical protein
VTWALLCSANELELDSTSIQPYFFPHISHFSLLQLPHITCPHLYDPIFWRRIYLLQIPQQYYSPICFTINDLSFLRVSLWFVAAGHFTDSSISYFLFYYWIFGVFSVAQKDDFTNFYFCVVNSYTPMGFAYFGSNF